MKTTLAKRAALITVLVLGSSTWLSAQDDPAPIARPQGGLVGQPEPRTPALGTNSQPMKINKGSTFIGATVKNPQGEDLGKIHDIVIDFASDKIGYVVLGNRTGVLSPQKFHAVPLRAFQPDPQGTGLILNADKAKLESSVGFDKDNWPAVGTSTWGAEPFWKESQENNGTLRVRELDKQIRENAIKEPYKTEPQPKP